MQPLGALLLGGGLLELEQQDPADVVQFVAQPRVFLPRLLHGLLDVSAIDITPLPGAEVGAIDGKESQHLDKSPLEAVHGDVAAVAVPGGDILEQVGEIVEVAEHMFFDDELLFGVGHLCVGFAQPRMTPVDG